MILPGFLLPSRVNQIWLESGMDSYKLCLRPNHFKRYPHHVVYNYNSRGFRDPEWPETLKELQDAIWCFGDSFTVGIGSPIEHTWVNLLQSKLGRRCINVSMDGASNEWISRKAAEVLEIIKPKCIIVQWSFYWRSEATLGDSDESRRESRGIPGTDYLKTQFDSVSQIENIKDTCKIIHSSIPDSDFTLREYIEEMWNDIKGTDWPITPPKNFDEFQNLDQFVIDELNQFQPTLKSFYKLIQEITYFPVDEKLDLARDGFHYDLLTATKFVSEITNGEFNRSSS